MGFQTTWLIYLPFSGGVAAYRAPLRSTLERLTQTGRVDFWRTSLWLRPGRFLTKEGTQHDSVVMLPRPDATLGLGIYPPL